MKLENINESKNRDGEFNFEKIFYILIHQWHWFLLFCVLGVGCAYIYTMLTDPRFRVSASVLVTGKSNEIDIKNIFKATPYQSEKHIYNQIEIIKLYNRRQNISFSATENSPTLVNINKELAQTHKLINETLGNLSDNATKSSSSLKNREASINSQMNKLPRKEQQMINLQRQFDMTSEIYTFLLQKRAELNIALASSMPDVQIIDQVRPETATPIGLPPNLILILGLIIGFALPLGIILLINNFDAHIRTQEDVEDNTTIPILGSIIHDHANSIITVHENPKSIIAESFRAFRTNLQFMLTEPNGKIISIQSANPGEGKTFTAIKLASILAMNDKKVLLIGADLRKSRLHKIFNLSNERGLSTWLIDRNTIHEVIFPTPIDHLFLLPSGPMPPNPSEILGKHAMKILIDTVRDAFDYIILNNAQNQQEVLGSTHNLDELIAEHKIQMIFSVQDAANQEFNQKLAAKCDKYGVRLRLIVRHKNRYKFQPDFETLSGIELRNPRKIPLDDTRAKISKRLFDIVFSSLVILGVFTWLFPVVALIIKLTSRGPVFFMQKRTGINNKTFNCIKFRSMKLNILSDIKQASVNDIRITPFGQFLRTSHIDELPQFFNVFWGQMSVIGPRPHMLKHTEQYSELIEHYLMRHYVKPGITGWAQINGYCGETKELWKMEKRVECDLFYVFNWTFYWDIKIIWRTVFKMNTNKMQSFKFDNIPFLTKDIQKSDKVHNVTEHILSGIS